MSDTPGGPGSSGQGPDDNNPFKGTPFEQIFSQLGGFGAGGGGMPDLNALMSQMQSLMESLPSDMRQQLQDLPMDKIGDPELREELADLQANLEYMYPQRDLRNQYPFRGEEELDLTEAMRVMENMQDMDEL